MYSRVQNPTRAWSGDNSDDNNDDVERLTGANTKLTEQESLLRERANTWGSNGDAEDSRDFRSRLRSGRSGSLTSRPPRPQSTWGSAPASRDASMGNIRVPQKQARGLSTTAAYRTLFSVTEKVLDKWSAARAPRFVWFVDPNFEKDVPKNAANNHKKADPPKRIWPTDRLSPLSYSLVMLLVGGLMGLSAALIRADGDRNYRASELTIESIIIVLIAIFHALLISHERRLRHSELSSRLSAIIRKFRVLLERHCVTRGHYMALDSVYPISACDAVPTIRDGALVGVPAVLLVAGDVITLRPGDRAPATIRQMEEAASGTSGGNVNPLILTPGEAFLRDTGRAPVTIDATKMVDPPRTYEFVVLEGILESNLDIIHTRTKARRWTALNSQRILTTIMLQRAAVVVFLFALTVNLIRVFVTKDDVGDYDEMLIVLPVYCIVPFLPLAFPAVWILVNLYATAELFGLLPTPSRGEADGDRTDDELGKEDVVSLDSWGSDLSDAGADDTAQRTPRSVVLNYFFRGLQGGAGILTRTTNMVHTLGYLSVLSCIDKRGILAQPMPSPETMFLFSDVTDGPEDADSAGEDNESSTTAVEGKDEHSNADDATDVTDAASSRGDADEDGAGRSVASSQTADEDSIASRKRDTPSVTVTEQGASVVVMSARSGEDSTPPDGAQQRAQMLRQAHGTDDEGNDSWDEDTISTPKSTPADPAAVGTHPLRTTATLQQPSGDTDMQRASGGEDVAPVAPTPARAGDQVHNGATDTAGGKSASKQRKNRQRRQRSQSSSTSASMDTASRAKRSVRGSQRKRTVRRVVLDLLSSPLYKPNGLRFADTAWQRLIESLKPLGLTMLLNSPCRNPVCGRDLSNHLSHVEAKVQGLPDKVLLAAARARTGLRACICRLACEMGFTKDAISMFEYRQSFVTASPFHHSQKAMNGDGDNQSRGRGLTPHMVTTIVEESEQGTLQMFTAGTGDLLPEYCSEIWTGSAVLPISDRQRRQIVDFYNKTSSTMTCYAFAYRPMYSATATGGGGSAAPDHADNAVYVELRGDPDVRRTLLGARTSTCDADHYTHQDRRAPRASPLADRPTSRSQYGSLDVEPGLSSSAPSLALQRGDASVNAHGEDSDGDASDYLLAGPSTAAEEHPHGVGRGNSLGNGGNVPTAAPWRLPRGRAPPLGADELRRWASAVADGEASSIVLAAPPTNHAPPTLDTRGSLVGSAASDVVFAGAGAEPLTPTTPTSEGSRGGSVVPRARVTDLEQSQKLQSNQIFLGMVGVQDQPLPDVQDMIESLYAGGIRFVYFSSEGAVDSKTFADKLGIETGWNCHISLNEDGRNEYGKEESNAQLPRGIKKMKHHIATVDDVPLLVPLFSGCTPQSSSEMIGIMQDHRRVVCCIGSSLNSFGVHAFAQADMSLSFDPLQSSQCLSLNALSTPFTVLHGAASEPLAGGVKRSETTAASVAAHFNTMACSFGLHRDADMTLIKLIKESRRLSLNMRQCFVYLLFAQATLVLLNVMSSVLLLYPILNGVQIMWSCMVPLPLVGASFLATPPEQKLSQLHMTDVSKDRTEWWRWIRLYAWYFFARAVPIVTVLLFLFGYILYEACERDARDFRGGKCHVLLGNRDIDSEWNGRFGPELESTVLAQNVVHWLFAMYCCVMSGTMMHRSLPFSKTVNRSWAVAVVLAMALQTAFSGVYIFAYGRGRLMSLTTLPIAVYVVAFVWPFVLMATNSKVRRHFAAKDAREQRWIKLRFSTKLGMHSPK
eukprot:m.1242134 g.1242134  ORF g.1242134 m.1242134 type:complete len:1754 (-) comp24682_c0_seq1:57-5318(-)